MTLAILVFLISGTSGLFSSKITLVSYFDNAEGIRQGQPVDFSGVPIGNVTAVHVVRGRPTAPVQVVMKVNQKYREFIVSGEKGSTATVQTAGVLGESFIDIITKVGATGPQVKDGDELKAGNTPGYADVIRSSQGTLQNIDVLLGHANDILAQIQGGKGTLGQVIYDPAMINKINGILNQVQGLLNDVNNGQGTIGQLFKDKTLYLKANDAIDKLD
ncbi:MAG TPA: MlaD family protein, partial [Candidatus Angelobacter sp.]|nr:MlaD family protein [Candidatus Angelobacter sp.]